MKGIISIFVVLVHLIAFTQDSLYIQSYKRGLVVNTLLAGKYVQLEFKPSKKSEYPSLIYRPNLPGKFGFKIGYNGIALTYLSNFNTYSKNPLIYGEAKFKTLELNVSTKKWWYRVDYSSTKGFYVDNVGDFIKPISVDLPPLVVSHLSFKRYSFSGMYILNNSKYSHKCWINQLEKQKKSAGSFLFQYNVFRTITVADTAIIPLRFSNEYSELNSMKNAQINNLILQVGYGHTFTIKEKISIGGRLLFGSGYQSRKFTNVRRQVNKSNNFGLKGDFGFFITHAGERFNYGFLFDATTVSSRIRLLNLNASFTSTRLFFGVRFPNVRFMTSKSKLFKIKWLKKWAIDGEF